MSSSACASSSVHRRSSAIDFITSAFIPNTLTDLLPRSDISPHGCLWRSHRRPIKHRDQGFAGRIDPTVTNLLWRAIKAKDEHYTVPSDFSLEAFDYMDALDEAARCLLLIADDVGHVVGTHASFTKSETSHRRSVTFAAMAGVMRMEE